MSTYNLNLVAVTGNLTRDPELVTLPSGHIFCKMQIACNYRDRDEVTGTWNEQTDYFTVKAFGFHGRASHEHLCKGQPVAIQGRLSSRRTYSIDPEQDWATEIIAYTVQFLAGLRKG